MIFMRNLSLKWKISGFFWVLLLLVVTFLVIFLKLSITQKFNEQIGERGLDILRTVALNIDSEEYQKLLESKDDTSEFYKKTCIYLKSVQEKVGFKYLYTESYLEDGKTTIYVLDAGDPAIDDLSPLGSLVNETEMVDTEEVYKTLDKGTPTYTKAYYTEEWGSIVSCNYSISQSSNGMGDQIEELVKLSSNSKESNEKLLEHVSIFKI